MPKCVVVGAGGISNAWFPPLKAEQVQVAAVVDLRQDAALAQIKKHELGAEACTDLAGALREHKPDFVVDLTIPAAHCAVTCQALEAGFHVIGEKPMAASMAEAKRMVAAAEKAKRLYMVSQSRRFEPGLGAYISALRSGVVGELTTANCDFYLGAHFGGFRDEMPSPLILDMAIHHFDLARLFTGCDPVAVYAKEFNPKGSWYKGAVAATCIFEMTNNLVFTYRGSWCAEGCRTGWNGDWRIIGTQGTLLSTGDKTSGQRLAGEGGFSRPLMNLDVPPQEQKFPGMHSALREMLECLKTGKTPQTECHDNIKSLAMVFAAIESSKRGQRVEIGSLL